MAVRNPTAFTEWNDEGALYTGESILTTVPTAVADDQVFVLDETQLILSECFARIGTTDAAFGTRRATWYFDSKDMCGHGGANNEITHTVWILAWVSAAATDGEVRFTGTAVASNTVTIALDISVTTAQWYSGSMNIKTEGTQEEFYVESRRTAGAGTVYIGGVAVVADET